MLSIPLFIFLALYFIFLLFFIFFICVDLYHIVTTGEFTLPSLAMTVFAFFTSAIIIFLTWYFIASLDINWSESITVIGSSFTDQSFENF